MPNVNGCRLLILDCDGVLIRSEDANLAYYNHLFREFGLPYAPDPGVTRYLAAFLSADRHLALDGVELAEGVDPARPDIVLFNGGFFASDLLRFFAHAGRS